MRATYMNCRKALDRPFSRGVAPIRRAVRAPANRPQTWPSHEMHQVKKGNEWRFGMKLHIGVDSQTGVVHSVSTTAANVHDVTETHRLLHGGETRVWADAGYKGVHKRPENRGLAIKWRVAMRPGLRRQLEPGSEQAQGEKLKASVRAKVEHPFQKVKRLFGYSKVRYRGWPRTRSGCWSWWDWPT